MDVDFDPQSIEHWGLLLLCIIAIPIGFWLVECEERRDRKRRQK